MKKLETCSLSTLLIPARDLETIHMHGNAPVMMAVQFGPSFDGSSDENFLQVSTGLEQLTGDPLVEVWTSELPFDKGQAGNIRYARNADFMIGAVQHRETDSGSLEGLSFQTYSRLLAETERLGYPFLARCWNYFPGINLMESGLERYKLFCTGRHDAFAQKYDDIDLHLPAGSGVGSPDGPFTVMFIAARHHNGFHMENPRQVSAYRYPKKYGMRSPSFARATFQDWGEQKHLYLAGTASIAGHESRHIGNVKEQTLETLRNIRALLNHAQSLLDDRNGIRITEEPLLLKIYIRHPEDLDTVQKIIEENFGAEDSGIFLQGNICRKELLVEIEGIWSVNEVS